MIRRAVVTGAFSYSGGVIARRLLDQGCEVVSLSRRAAPAGHPLAGAVAVEPLQFGDADALERALRGAEVLFNTYWIRFGRDGASFDGAVENSRVLFAAARRAGVGRIVHLSVTNASAGSPFAYFRGKAAVERVLAETTPEHAVIRPSLVFGGREEILVNNMAWLLRRLPVYAVPGDGAYRVQPVAVGDVADLALAAALAQRRVHRGRGRARGVHVRRVPQACSPPPWALVRGSCTCRPRPSSRLAARSASSSATR